MPESIPKTFTQIENEMKLKGFHFLKYESARETNFDTKIKLFVEEDIHSEESLKKQYESKYPDLEIELMKIGHHTYYVFGKLK